MDLITLALAKKYTNDALDGVTTIKGKNCQIQSIDTTTHTSKAVITFAYYDEDDVLKTSTLDVPYANGKNIKTISSVHVDPTDVDDGYTAVTITANDDTTSTFNVPDGLDGNGVSSAIATMSATSQFITFDMDDGSSILCSWTRLPKITTGFEISTDGAADDTKYVLGDMYINLNTQYFYVAENVGSPAVLTWKKKAELKGDQGDSVYKTWLELNPSGTKSEFIAAMSGDAIQMEKVWEKPDIRRSSTEVNKWYFYQDNDNESQHYLRNFIDSGSYITDRVKVAANCNIEKNTVYTWPAYLTGYTMCIKFSNDTQLLRNDEIGIQYDLTNAKIPSAIRPENKAIFFKVASDRDWTQIEKVTGANITRVADADVPSGAVALSSVIGVTIIGKKLIDELTKTTAWRVLSNYSTTAVIPAGHNCVWNGSKYLNFATTTPIDASALSSVFSEGVALFTDEYITRGWVVAKNKYIPSGETEEVTEECLVIGIGAHLTTTDEVGEGVTDLSTYFNEPIPLGIYKQTIYVGVDKSHCDEVTLATGSATAGAFVTETTFNETVNPKLEWSGLVKAAYPNVNDRTIKNVLNGTFERTTSKGSNKDEVETKNSSQYSTGHVNGIDKFKFNTTSGNKGWECNTVQPPSDNIITWSNTVKQSLAFNETLSLMFDAIMPIGTIVFNKKPNWGTWQPYNFNGYVCVDTTLNLSEGVALNMNERLPNIKGEYSVTSIGYGFTGGSYSGALSKGTHRNGGYSGNGSSADGFKINAADSTTEGANVYTDSQKTNGYNVEVKGKCITAFIRTE